jgi:outer membrane protein assembly factor BamB
LKVSHFFTEKYYTENMQNAPAPSILPLILILCTAPVIYAESPAAVIENGEDGETVNARPFWRAALGGVVTGPPTVQAGTVVAVLDGGNLRAYTLEGRKLWDYYAGGKLTPHVTRSREGTCYLYRNDGSLIAVNRAGRELWKFKPSRTGNESIAGPVVSGWDGRIFVTLGGAVYCYTASGNRLWSAELGHRPVLGPLSGPAGGLLMALENGELAEISHLGVLRKQRLGELPAALVPAENGVLVLFRNGWPRYYRSLFAAGRGAGESFSAAATLPNLGGIPVGGVTLGDRAAILLANGKLVCLSLSEGKILWTVNSHVKSGELVPGGAAKTGGGDLDMRYDKAGIHILTAAGASSFNAAGQRRWMILIQGGTALPALGDNGALYSGGADWILYAYRLEDSETAGHGGFYGPAPAGSYRLADPRPSPWAAFPYLFRETEIRAQLAAIAAHVRAGTIGEDEPAFTAYLMEVSAPVNGPGAERDTHPPVQPRERAEAARLLGYIGSRETVPFLVTVFMRDTDSVVKAAVAGAIGRVGADSDGRAFAAFGAAARSPAKDDQVLEAAAGAVSAICRFSGPPLSDAGIRLLTAMAVDTMPPATRVRARRELDTLR